MTHPLGASSLQEVKTTKDFLYIANLGQVHMINAVYQT